MDRRVWQQLPNTLTVARLLLAAAFFGALNAYRFPDTNIAWGNVAIVFFILAAITDALDGYLARRWHVESTFGRIMDPFCDKVLILGAFIYLAGPRFIVEERIVEGDSVFVMATSVYPWMVVIILARELLVTGIRGLVEGEGMAFKTSWSGKAKMILQSIIVPIVLCLVINFNPAKYAWSDWICMVLVYLTVVVTVWSGIPYITGLPKLLKQKREAVEGSSQP